MLLLVLILVLLAFALLVVALLTNSVIAAWVSVGLSIVAAVVLLIDWLQRRAAVKAGEASLLSGDADLTRAPEPPRAQYEPEPATEVLPVVPPAPMQGAPAPSGYPGEARTEVGTTKTAVEPVPGGIPGESPSTSDVVDLAKGGSQNTVFIAPVQPPGSAAQPSGAEGGITGSSGSSSLSVTKSASDPAPKESSDTVDPAADVDQPTSLVDNREKAGAAADGGIDPAAATADQQPATGVAPGAAGVAHQSPAQVGANSSMSGSDLFGSGAAATVHEPVVQEPVVEATIDNDPPEEHASPEALALVAGLEDEVIVIDEQPRYHVPGCRSLTAQTPIPLPAREAVELGFTPCGWCSPDRTLAERHPAAAH